MPSQTDSDWKSLDVGILCEDGPVLAVNKPPGIITQGAPEGIPSLVDWAKHYLREKYNKPGRVYLGIPHRLDRPVSGVVVFSRNSKCAARLAEQFAQRQVKKEYVAVLERPPEPRSGRLEDWIYRIPEQPRVEIADAQRTGAKRAVLTYETLRVHQGLALVKIQLETGRMHQIRIQFASRGCGVLGDDQYGAKRQFPGCTAALPSPIALHAWRLVILHPVRYEELPIIAPVPKSWESLGMGREITAMDLSEL